MAQRAEFDEDWTENQKVAKHKMAAITMINASKKRKEKERKKEENLADLMSTKSKSKDCTAWDSGLRAIREKREKK